MLVECLPCSPRCSFQSVFHKFVFIALATTLLAGPASASPDNDFLAAREAYAKGRIDQLDRLAERLPVNYPLAPYLRYWRIKSRSPASADWLAFANQHPDSPLGQRAWLELAREHGKTENWPAFRNAYARLAKSDQELRCYQLRARLAELDSSAETEASELYRGAQDLPSSCEPLFALLNDRGLLSTEARLARLRLALEAGNLRLAGEIINTFPTLQASEKRGLDSLITEAGRTPEKTLGIHPNSALEQEIVLYALTQIAKKNVDQAVKHWDKARLGLPENIGQHGWAIVALAAARAHRPEAVEWFLLGKEQLSDNQKIWKARTMLRAGRWLDVYQTIVSLPKTIQEEAIWRYWKARALKALNAGVLANQLFANLSREIHYYALLADEELPVRLESRPAEFRPTAEDIAFVEQQPGLKRALLLRRIGLNTEAVAEWDWGLRAMSDQQILAAAELARREQWYDRAILTAEKTREIHSFDLRYLTPYRDLAEAQARQNGLDPAWVYGLMRQESRFIDYARSGVGAQGLMQIMPATARWIARQLSLDRKAHAKMNDPEANIRFGTFYMKNVLDSLHGSPVLASAGYNAGPGRARKWQAEVPLEGAIYIESIPFTETREYVKKVMANAVYYSQRLGVGGGSLKARLGLIPPRNLSKIEQSSSSAP